MKPSLILVGLLSAAPAFSADALSQAIGFALTGSDDAKVRAVDPKDCIYAVGNVTYRLNNVHVDRIALKGWTEKAVVAGIERQRPFVTVELHGDATIYESVTVEPATTGEEGLPPELVREMKKRDLIKPTPKRTERTALNQATLTLWTIELDRVKRAWEYIYANGCTGKKSPF